MLSRTQLLSVTHHEYLCRRDPLPCAAIRRSTFRTGTAFRSTTAFRRRGCPSTPSARCTSPPGGAGTQAHAHVHPRTLTCNLQRGGCSGRLFDGAKGEGIALSQYDLAEVCGVLHVACSSTTGADGLAHVCVLHNSCCRLYCNGACCMLACTRSRWDSASSAFRSWRTRLAESSSVRRRRLRCFTAGGVNTQLHTV